MRLYPIHTPLVSLFLIAIAITTGASAAPGRGPVLRDVAQFPNTTWVENLAVRSNGNLLVTLLSAPELFQVDPAGNGQQPQLVHQFSNITSLTGIAEVEKDVFAVAGGNISLATLTSTKGSFHLGCVCSLSSPLNLRLVLGLESRYAIRQIPILC
jgi:hypothetical protein